MKKGRILYAVLGAALMIAALGGCAQSGGRDESSAVPASSGSESSIAAESSSAEAGSATKSSSAAKNSSSDASGSEGSAAHSSAQESSKRESSAQESSNSSSPAQQSESKQTESENSTGFVGFNGVSEDYTLRELYESSEYTDLIETAKKQYESDKYTIDYELAGENRIIITATLNQQLDSTAIDRETSEPYFETLKEQAGTYIGLLEGITTTDNIEITAILRNADGSELMRRTFDHDNTHADQEELPKRDLSAVAESPMVSNMLSGLPDSIGDSSATVSAGVKGSDELIITINLSSPVPQGAEAAVQAKLEGISAEKESIRSQLAILTGNADIKVTVEALDAAGRTVAHTNS